MAENRMNQTKVSILLHAWKEGSKIIRAIKSFLTLTYPKAELIVVAGGNEIYKMAKKV